MARKDRIVDDPFTGDLLRLAPFEADHQSQLMEILNHPELTGRRFLPDGFSETIPLTSHKVESMMKHWEEQDRGFRLAIIDLDSQELLGHAGCDWGWDPHHPSLSIVIDPLRHGRGFGGETLRLLLSYLFNRTLAHNVHGWIPDWNQPAVDFCLHHGFQIAGKVRRAGLRGGVFFGYSIVELLRPEWRSKLGEQ